MAEKKVTLKEGTTKLYPATKASIIQNDGIISCDGINPGAGGLTFTTKPINSGILKVMDGTLELKSSYGQTVLGSSNSSNEGTSIYGANITLNSPAGTINLNDKINIDADKINLDNQIEINKNSINLLNFKDTLALGTDSEGNIIKTPIVDSTTTKNVGLLKLPPRNENPSFVQDADGFHFNYVTKFTPGVYLVYPIKLSNLSGFTFEGENFMIAMLQIANISQAGLVPASTHAYMIGINYVGQVAVKKYTTLNPELLPLSIENAQGVRIAQYV